MLRHLHVKNLALIDDLELSFECGLNVITGETGAGKSLLMQAIGLALGSRATADLIRRDTTEAVVEAVFSVEDGRVAHVLEEHGVLEENAALQDEELIIRRVISHSGRSRVYLNGALTTAGILRQISAGLMQIYGQHEQKILREPDSVLRLLDGFAVSAKRTHEMSNRYHALRRVWERLCALTEGKEAAEARQDLVRFQADEIRRVALEPGEEETLRQERTILLNAEKLYHVASGGEDVLAAGEDAVADQIGRLLSQLRELVQVDTSLNEVLSLLTDGLAQVEEAALSLRKYREHLSPHPERLEDLDTRLGLISRLKKKYGGSIEAVLARYAELEQELEHIDDGAETITALQQEVEPAAHAAWTWAKKLSKERHTTAQRLEHNIQAELARLGLRGASFGVHFQQQETHGSAVAPFIQNGQRLTESGFDQVEFYLSANPGEPLLPLIQVASGGELSRLMLALKALSAAAEATPTLIFDEVDSGIGGAVAEVVGRRLKALAAQHQILCITHLPQIAAFADHAYIVVKKVTKGRSISSAKHLAHRERLQELARMLGGVEITAEARSHAREMLEGARRG